jgi:predicted nucleic acid-binding protein
LPVNSKITLFWDSSGLIAAILSPKENSPGRLLLKLGEAGAVDMRVSREVLGDCDRVLRRINPERVKQLAVILHQANIATTLDPNSETIAYCHDMTGYEPDARVLAAAVECDADLFLTHDTEHFLQNPLIGPPDTRLRVMTLYEALDWVRERLKALAEGED